VAAKHSPAAQQPKDTEATATAAAEASGVLRRRAPGETNGRRSPQADQAGNSPSAAPGITPIGSLTKPGRATVEGRVRAVEIRPVEQNSVLAAEIADSTGELTALFYGRSRIPGLICGARVRFRGTVGIRAGRVFMVNPTYELLPPGPDQPGAEDGQS
jgi:hypothetical protein